MGLQNRSSSRGWQAIFDLYFVGACCGLPTSIRDFRLADLHLADLRAIRVRYALIFVEAVVMVRPSPPVPLSRSCFSGASPSTFPLALWPPFNILLCAINVFHSLHTFNTSKTTYPI